MLVFNLYNYCIFVELMKLSGEVAEDLSLIAEKRKEDREEEETFQSRLGARSPSQICAGLWKDADNYSKYHTQAVSIIFTFYKLQWYIYITFLKRPITYLLVNINTAMLLAYFIIGNLHRNMK